MIIPLSIILVIILNSKERSLIDQMEQQRLNKYCTEKIYSLGKLMNALYTLNKNYNLSKVENFSKALKKCTQIVDYENLLT